MRYLAGEIGMAKSALYRYFPDKRELFAGTVARDESRELREAPAGGGAAYGEALAAPLSWLVDAVRGSAPASAMAREEVHG